MHGMLASLGTKLGCKRLLRFATAGAGAKWSDMVWQAGDLAVRPRGGLRYSGTASVSVSA
eukprot:1443930-Rhodomonas_salina.1